MEKKVRVLVVLTVLLAMVLSACQPAVATVEPVAPVVEPTAVPPTATPVPVEPTAAPVDWAAVMTEVIASMPADAGYASVSAAKLNEELVDSAPFLLDVREASEVEAEGYIAGAVQIPVRDLLKNLDKLPGLDEPIVVYCASGHRGGMAMAALKALGYSKVRNLGGGLGAWKKAELGVETGAVPEAAAGTAPDVDAGMLAELDAFFSNLPDGFYAMKASAVDELLVSEMPFLLDVRSEKEVAEGGYIEGSFNIPLDKLLTSLNEFSKEEQIVVYCASGHRGGVAMTALRLLGYDAINLGGGLNAWKAAGLPVAGVVDWNATWANFLSSLPEGFYSVSPANLNAEMVDAMPFLLDVREASEFEAGYLAGAVNIPIRELLKNLDKLPAQDEPIVIYCGSGHRGALGLAALNLLGYTNVRNLGGGTGAWTKAELPLVTEGAGELVAGTAPEVDPMLFAKLDEHLSNLPEGFGTVKAADLNAEMAEAAPFILDVREASEVEADGYIEGSVLIPVREVFASLDQLPADKAAPIVVLCKSGHRGAFVQMALQMNGYTNVRNLNGGLGAWIGAELPVVK
ncbi:MAG: hypothetical protein JW987_15575 [Anaerolineaceae bacterium]|nr:hypothetical protein [Anaerolineaceae bacterium]